MFKSSSLIPSRRHASTTMGAPNGSAVSMSLISPSSLQTPQPFNRTTARCYHQTGHYFRPAQSDVGAGPWNDLLDASAMGNRPPQSSRTPKAAQINVGGTKVAPTTSYGAISARRSVYTKQSVPLSIRHSTHGCVHGRVGQQQHVWSYALMP